MKNYSPEYGPYRSECIRCGECQELYFGQGLCWSCYNIVVEENVIDEAWDTIVDAFINDTHLPYIPKGDTDD